MLHCPIFFLSFHVFLISFSQLCICVTFNKCYFGGAPNFSHIPMIDFLSTCPQINTPPNLNNNNNNNKTLSSHFYNQTSCIRTDNTGSKARSRSLLVFTGHPGLHRHCYWLFAAFNILGGDRLYVAFLLGKCTVCPATGYNTGTN